MGCHRGIPGILFQVRETTVGSGGVRPETSGEVRMKDGGKESVGSESGKIRRPVRRL